MSLAAPPDSHLDAVGVDAPSVDVSCKGSCSSSRSINILSAAVWLQGEKCTQDGNFPPRVLSLLCIYIYWLSPSFSLAPPFSCRWAFAEGRDRCSWIIFAGVIAVTGDKPLTWLFVFSNVISFVFKRAKQRSLSFRSRGQKGSCSLVFLGVGKMLWL